MARCKIHLKYDWVECDHCNKKGCRMCEEGWKDNHSTGERTCPECSNVIKYKALTPEAEEKEDD